MVLGIEVFLWYGMQKQQALMHWAKIAHDAYLWQTWENNRRTGTEGGEMPADEEWPDGDQWPDCSIEAKQCGTVCRAYIPSQVHVVVVVCSNLF